MAIKGSRLRGVDAQAHGGSLLEDLL